MARSRTAVARSRTFVREPAVVLSRRPGPRTSHWVWFYGERSGLLEVIAEAARRPRKLVAGTLEPLSVGWLTYRATGDAPTHRFIGFDLTWSPYVALQAAGRPIAPTTLVFVSLVAETALALLPGHPGDAYVFQRLSEVSRLMTQAVPYRALAIGWLWTLLMRLGDLSLEGTCPACGRPVGGLETSDAVWDVEGHLWHPACGPGPTPTAGRHRPPYGKGWPVWRPAVWPPGASTPRRPGPWPGNGTCGNSWSGGPNS